MQRATWWSRPAVRAAAGLDLDVLISDLGRRGIGLPLLLRFPDLLRARLDTIAGAFHTAIAENEYQGQYRGVYPIKVNQQRQVVEDIVRFSAVRYHIGLEAGSKPELLAALSQLEDPEALIVCNGYKDRGVHRHSRCWPQPSIGPSRRRSSSRSSSELASSSCESLARLRRPPNCSACAPPVEPRLRGWEESGGSALEVRALDARS